MTRQDFAETRDSYLKSRHLKAKVFEQGMADCIRRAYVRDGCGGEGYRRDVLHSPRCQAMIIGGIMENEALMIRAINGELEESKEILEKLANEVRALNDIVGPALLAHAQMLRAARMTVVSELQSSLAAMKDVRRFFLESDYESEMTRLERFVRVCKEIQSLKQDGVFDAVVTAAIHLGAKE